MMPDPSFWENGVFLHASSVLTPKGALLFLGHSSSGKTTIARMLSPEFSFIADDSVFVQYHEGDWYVRNGNFRKFWQIQAPGVPETTGEGEKSFQTFPLAAIFRIFKSSSTTLKPISPKMLCKHLLDAVFEIDVQRNLNDTALRKKWFTLSATIARMTSGYYLKFDRTPTIINLLNRNFGSETEFGGSNG